VEAQRAAGSVARPVRWSLPNGGTLILEVAGRDLGRSRVVVRGAGRDVIAPITVGRDPETARFVTVELPAGSYRQVSIELSPVPGLTSVDEATGLTVPRGGRLDLRGYRVVPAGSGSLPASRIP
jgi:hypothetical protein